MRKVLIVDDELQICRLVKKMLEGTGEYEVMFCTNSNAALDLAKRSQPDLILLDIAMPDVSGPELAQQLKSAPATKDIPSIYLTGMVGQAEVEEAGHMISGHYFVAKPVQKADLLHAIDTSLQLKDAGATAPADSAEMTVHTAELLGHLLKIRQDSDGYFQMSIKGLKPVKGEIAFFTLKEAQEAAHALIHFHVEKVRYCTCNEPLGWKESAQQT